MKNLFIIIFTLFFSLYSSSSNASIELVSHESLVNLKDKKILALLKETCDIIQSNNVQAGSMAKDVEYARILLDLGYDFIAFYNDAAALNSYFQDSLIKIKKP
mgnify:CR=1 FL=1